MKLKLYNSLTHKVEEFKPLDSKQVKMYSCGPTIYNNAHIGNMRAFLFADLLQRIIRVVGGYDLMWVMNLTDIDDKTIRDSKKGSPAWKKEMGEQTDDPKENLKKLTDFYKKVFLDDISKLGINIKDFDALPRATEYIDKMQDLVTRIYEKGYAYIADGSVYFSVGKWAHDDKYGKLFNVDFDNFKQGERIDEDEYEREQVSDFVIWKSKKEDEPCWDFELDGKSIPGRPGWHIECSTMEYDILGVPFDIHTGGVDLKFPHHEDEIAQSKAGYGVEPTNYWCHNEFLEVEGTKMSKSAGNFFILNDLLEKGLDPLDIRFAMLSAHYATKYNFTFKGIEAAHKARMRVQEFIYGLFEQIETGTKPVDAAKVKQDVFSELANDAHTPKALGKLFTFINNTDPKDLDKESKAKLIEFFTDLNNIFDVWEIKEKQESKTEIPQEIKDMAEKRFAAKKEKNFALADELRDKIQQAGYVVKDRKDGYEIEEK